MNQSTPKKDPDKEPPSDPHRKGPAKPIERDEPERRMPETEWENPERRVPDEIERGNPEHKERER